VKQSGKMAERQNTVQLFRAKEFSTCSSHPGRFSHQCTFATLSPKKLVKVHFGQSFLMASTSLQAEFLAENFCS
jgi:hypothetical protein